MYVYVCVYVSVCVCVCVCGALSLLICCFDLEHVLGCCPAGGEKVFTEVDQDTWDLGAVGIVGNEFHQSNTELLLPVPH